MPRATCTRMHKRASKSTVCGGNRQHTSLQLNRQHLCSDNSWGGGCFNCVSALVCVCTAYQVAPMRPVED